VCVASVDAPTRRGMGSARGAARCAVATGSATGSSAPHSRRSRARPHRPAASVGAPSRPSTTSPRGAVACARCTGAGMAGNARPSRRGRSRGPSRRLGRVATVAGSPRNGRGDAVCPAIRTGTAPAASARRSCGSGNRLRATGGRGQMWRGLPTIHRGLTYSPQRDPRLSSGCLLRHGRLEHAMHRWLTPHSFAWFWLWRCSCRRLALLWQRQ
jgi:hypothetical protein